MKYIGYLVLIALFSCKQPASADLEITQQVDDPHSYANPAEVVARHLDLDIKVDFNSKQIAGKASWTIQQLTNAGKIIFDTWKLKVEKVTLGPEEKPAVFKLGKADDIFGQPLEVSLDTGTRVVNIYYSTSPEAGALQWLQPQQTGGKKHPYLFTQSQPILARSWVPSQDGPAVRFTYNAKVQVPAELLAVMSAENPQEKNDSGIYFFRQPKPVPSYLLALAVGDIGFKAIDHRTGVYAEPGMLDKAAWEFADMGRMVSAAEALYGPYQWERYDLLVLPPSFPYGGMENPMLTFATPTVIAGDRSLVSLVAHELAHSWSGNLVTNATWEDIWLNEGFTTYFEKRIIEAVYGKPEFNMQVVLSRQDLAEAIAELGDTSMDTRLKLDLEGRDPDLGLGTIAYEKGFAFLQVIESVVGRPAFDQFLKGYFSRNAFKSMTTEGFLAELKDAFKNTDGFEEKTRLREWVYGTGIPANITPAVSAEFNAIDTIISKWQQDKNTAGLNRKLSSTNQRLYFIRKLPAGITADDMAILDKEFHFSQSGNAEIQAAWYTWAIRKNYQPARPYIAQFLQLVGRRKFLRPLYGEMVKTEAGKEWAKEIYAKARGNYHPVAYNTVDEILGLK